MTMRLLSKSEIAKAKSNDRQREVEEGLKLAKKVDALREISVEEEASLEKFRVKTLQKIQEEIVKEINKREVLKLEVKKLEERKLLAIHPLDDEWKKVREFKENLTTKERGLEIWKSELGEKDHILDKKENDIDVKKKQVEDTYRVVNEVLQETDTIKVDIERKKLKADEVLKNAEDRSFILLSNAEQQLKLASDKEKEVSRKEEELKQKESDLAAEWSLLKDRQEIFIRNKKRLNG